MSGYEVVEGPIVETQDGTVTASAHCTGTKKIIGGGHEALDGSSDHLWEVSVSRPVDQNHWVAIMRSTAPGAHRARAYAICVNA
ncbi:hypothetical protein EV192_102126 [Actinocrispum wychmicini]|uniref:Uncharacterized protein n=1 Tax=Actinocrispum wychmicini TaxID=1213861 RepID=A0A4R2JXR2_9PSEU|nr:hypothetical protein EV192_102126 [Actinocrispum wychmicini]